MIDTMSIIKIKESYPGYIMHWIYMEHERPILLVARYDNNDEKTYRQFHWHNSEWKVGMPQPPYPLFGLDTLKHISPFGGPIICEGEKCAKVLQQFRWPALAMVLGASNVNSSDLTPLRHFKQFLILRDNDKAGIEFCHRAAVELKKIQPEANILVCNLTPDISGGDLVDWIQQKPLVGHKWDGFKDLKQDACEHVKNSLVAVIKQLSKPIEECPEIGFDKISCLFDGEPRPFHISLQPVPSFPVEVLPTDVSHYLQICAKQFSLPNDFSGTVFLSLLAGIIGRSTCLSMRPGQDWIESANIWAVLIGNPSSKKSPTYRRISRMIAALEQTAVHEHKLALKDHRRRKKEAKANNEDFDEEEPRMRRYTTDDCTTPKLRELMSYNPRGIILRNDELKGQLEKLDKMGSEGDRSFFMQCWSGRESYNEDRMTRNGGFQIPLTLTWIGCIPPTALATYLRQAQSYGSGADGFMQRFQMVTFPDITQPYEICQEIIPQELENKIQQVFVNIDKAALNNPDRTLHFDSEAQLLFDRWQTKLENDCRSGHHPIYWESHLGKQPKLLASLCIVLHRLLEVCSGSNSDAISIITFQAAETLRQYYQDHAQRCYDSIESLEVIDARRIIELIKNKRLPMRFKSQDIYRPGLGGLKDSQRVKAALELLRDSNWVALEKIQGHTGKPGEFWVVNPKAFKIST